jgi:exonuclease SbcC
VQFLTQKSGKGTKKQRQKLIDTLDIIIGDTTALVPTKPIQEGKLFGLISRFD